MTNQELADAVAEATRQSLKEIAEKFGVRFAFGGCCSCDETTLDVEVQPRGEFSFAWSQVFEGDMQ